MECLNCDDGIMRVTDTRAFAGTVYRKRRCKACGYTVWTEEVEADKRGLNAMFAYERRKERERKKVRKNEKVDKI